MEATRAAPQVWINGFPGSGKLTVATAVATLHNTAIVLDNHKLIDPVEAKYPRTHPFYQLERQLYRQAMLDGYVCSPATLSRLVICTGQYKPPDKDIDRQEQCSLNYLDFQTKR